MCIRDSLCGDDVMSEPPTGFLPRFEATVLSKGIDKIQHNQLISVVLD